MSSSALGARKAEDDSRPSKKPKVEENGQQQGNGESKQEPYTWKQVHDDLEADRFAGVYGGCNSAFFGLAEMRAGVDMMAFHKKRSPDEFYLEPLDELLQMPATRRRWNDILTMDPLGMYSSRPTMAATTARMTIPEFEGKLEVDGKIVNEDGSINCSKCAIDYVWNIPGLAERLKFDEKTMRKSLHKYTQNPTILDEKNKVFLPPLGGLTVYFFGDIRALAKKSTEVAVRVHDSCCGSDVFSTDICTCRPYLIFGLKGCVDVAQRGGVGIIAYFQKEGRSLGEVTKFRVYNARKRQEGGDRAEKYFYQTESIAGIRDARFQEMMPDVLLWLGITRIDWLLSMSSDKYDAITGAGIQVQQRVALPDRFVPKGAEVEITAKISAGYHAESLNSDDVIASLRSLEMVRERCYKVLKLAEEGKTRHFKLNYDKLGAASDYVFNLTKATYPDLNVPYHSRWRHFPAGSIEKITAKWHCDKNEKARRLIDLVTISVLMDAGAGATWKYVDSAGEEHVRSEGLAVATMDMFVDGMFSSDPAMKHRVNSHGLTHLRLEDFQHGFHVSHGNPLAGLEGRYKLLLRLGEALEKCPQFFGAEIPRPGNVVDYVLGHVKDGKVSIRVLWQAIIEGFESIWPNNLSGLRRGDIWVYNPLKVPGKPGSDMVPFHKLSQWLTLSMLEPFESLGIQFTDTNLFTGLAEYRNGGLFVDMGVLELKEDVTDMLFDVGSELVVEWRALTVCLLDKLAEFMRKQTGLSEQQLPLSKILQGGTWVAGRQLAAKRNGLPPISIRSDGSVF